MHIMRFKPALIVSLYLLQVSSINFDGYVTHSRSAIDSILLLFACGYKKSTRRPIVDIQDVYLDISRRKIIEIIVENMRESLANVVFGHFRSGHSITRFMTSPSGSRLKCLNIRPAIKWLNFLESEGKLHPNCAIVQRPLKLEINHDCSHVPNHDDHNEAISHNLSALICKPDVRFVVLLLDIGSGTYIRDEAVEVRHTNAVIFDSRNQTAERFEPHGHTRYSKYQKRLDKSQRRFLRRLKYVYIRPKVMSSAQKGPQLLQKVLPMQGGYCTVWSLMYVHARMTNPDRCPHESFVELCRGSPSQLLKNVASYLNVIDIDLKLNARNRHILTPDEQIQLFSTAFTDE